MDNLHNMRYRWAAYVCTRRYNINIYNCKYCTDSTVGIDYFVVEADERNDVDKFGVSRRFRSVVRGFRCGRRLVGLLPRPRCRRQR